MKMECELVEVYCRRCGGSWLSPLFMDQSISADVAELVRNGKTIQAISRLRESSGMQLHDAKGVVTHVSKSSNKCHRCNAPQSELGLATCENCGSLNYLW